MKEVQHKVTDGVPAHSRGQSNLYHTQPPCAGKLQLVPQVTATKGRETVEEGHTLEAP